MGTIAREESGEDEMQKLRSPCRSDNKGRTGAAALQSFPRSASAEGGDLAREASRITGLIAGLKVVELFWSFRTIETSRKKESEGR